MTEETPNPEHEPSGPGAEGAPAQPDPPQEAPASESVPPEGTDQAPPSAWPGPDAAAPVPSAEVPAAPSAPPFAQGPPPAVNPEPAQATGGPGPAPSPFTPPTSPPASAAPLEDEALREQRARRFGAGDAAGEDPARPLAGDPPTQAFAPEAPGAPAPMVTPIPAAPTHQSAPTHPSGHQFPPTSQMPAGPPPQFTGDEFADLREAPASRAAAHWWTVLITLVFAPVAWYLLTDGGARIAWAFSQGNIPAVATYIEFGLGLVAVFIFMLAARWSSVGAIILGSIFFALGLTYLIFPTEAATIVADSTQYFGRLGQFGINVVEHLGATLETGRMVFYGLVLIMVGVVSHGSRRQGRREERTKIALGE